MSGDRRGRQSHLRSIEVMNVIQINQRPGTETNRATAEVARLFDVAGREDETIRLLDGCMTRLHEVQQAKAALKGLTASELRAALEFRRQALGGEPA
jgi:hypothetical protein